MTTPAHQPDLVAWLRAQDDDDERVARAAERYWHGVRIESATTAEEDHALRHDPARVLAEVDATRRVLDLHGPSDTFNLGARNCVGCIYSWPCDNVLALALPYADREGFRDEWRPA